MICLMVVISLAQIKHQTSNILMTLLFLQLLLELMVSISPKNLTAFSLWLLKMMVPLGSKHILITELMVKEVVFQEHSHMKDTPVIYSKFQEQKMLPSIN